MENIETSRHSLAYIQSKLENDASIFVRNSMNLLSCGQYTKAKYLAIRDQYIQLREVAEEFGINFNQIMIMVNPAFWQDKLCPILGVLALD